MKIFSWTINTIFALVIITTLIAAVGSAITKEPVLLTVIRSNSMYPVWERGDMVIIQNLKELDAINQGDIVFFKVESGIFSDKGWIAHRVIGGDEAKGFITKGDANEYTDQQDGAYPIDRSWIAGRAKILGSQPIAIPKLGYLSLWMEDYQSNPLLLPAFAVILAILIGIGEIKSGQKRKKKSKGMDLQLIYIIGGFTISIIMGATMLTTSQKINLPYEVSEHGKGVIMGSAVGILEVGDEVTQPLSKLENKGFFPLIGSITTNDHQIVPSHQNIRLSKGEQLETTFSVYASNPGKYNSFIQVGLFYPFLPASIIYFLTQKSYWLALAIVSLIPGLPLIIYPFIDRKMRRSIFKTVRNKRRKLQNALPF